MYNAVTYSYTGACPHTGTTQTIRIEYFEIPMLGTLAKGYKKGSYSCPLYSECPYPEQDQYGRCPVYINAPDRPR